MGNVCECQIGREVQQKETPFPYATKLNENGFIINDYKKIEGSCFICLDDIKKRQTISSDCEINYCKLNAHAYCLYKWYAKYGSCPICSSKLTKKPDIYVYE